ncbi:Transcriptional regulator, XRE family [Candidatus Arthromitus sp. SFB-mouse-NL]|uniref:helix-turn-helix domain-containing protein n=1 Tax=Candidatus Arthromitus sp. SFB-mouse-NL TaxID=1508644 RepID=UPI00049A1351|nr:XRE family transcriptional regulator [Candidatus Arthromitus sp. SFB-mouse-NL]AID45408.1 Transcriptional regulator, XRE family [Candidatus Arthromitus sp. SFB-mouse-NL]
MNSKSFNGQNLRNARLYRRMTLNELASKINISKQSISLYENGRTMPDFEKIINISYVLDFPYEFFLQKHTFNYTPTTTYFKSFSSATKLNRISHSLRLNYMSKIYGALSDYVDFPRLNIPAIDFNIPDCAFYEENMVARDQIEHAAEYLRTFWGVGNKPLTNLKHLLEKNGIVITSFKTDDNKIDAFSQRSTIGNEEMYFIVSALGNKSEGRVNFDLSHELGHILLHPWSEDLESIPKEDFKAREKQANMFASAFLLPKDSFSERVKLYPTDLQYYKFLKNEWGVSMQAMIYRSYQLNIISFSQYQYLIKQISKNGWKTNEPDDYIYRPATNIFQDAIDLLISENVLSVKEIIDLIYRNGVIMNISNLENLLNLKHGTLINNEKIDNIIKLKFNT